MNIVYAFYNAGSFECTTTLLITCRSASSLSSPNKPAVPPKPKNIKSTPSPKKSSPEVKNRIISSGTLKCNTNSDTKSSEMQPEIIPKMRCDNGQAVISDPREKKGNVFSGNVYLIVIQSKYASQYINITF